MAGAAIATVSTQLPFNSSNYVFPLHKRLQSIQLPSSIPSHPHKITHLLLCQAKTNAESGDLNEVSFGGSEVMEEYDIDDDEEEEDNTESSVDLLLKLLHSMFKKVSKQVRKASRSVSFAVDGVLLLASLSVLKALLEVVCTLGGTVFGVILLLRVIWSAVSYFQSSANGPHHPRSSYGRPQPIT
ncbi:OLC1v1028116C1 [Oldenlandia corymbosa var. corymbosa]|uniref:OLC1v1028116C1 n=1 Tax=Oldenlandia corymbosa var. corymbosa TaxID=529605 RepID=A0AAV1CCT5_OLDCO|nr:OLC1v1028116C1 [Oldenlandia corymbosa var. corymbosa]